MAICKDNEGSGTDPQRGMGADHRPQQRVVPRVHEDDGRVDGVFTEGEFEVSEQKSKTLTEQIEDIKEQICNHYCKWPILWDEEIEGCELSESKWCAECPLNRL